MYYIYLNKENNQITDIKNKLVSYSDNLIVCEIETLPEKYNYLEVDNIREETKTWTEIQEDYDSNGEIVAKEIEKSRTYNTCDLKACFYPQPTTGQLEKLKYKKYEDLTEQYIAKRYSVKQEIAIARQKDVKPEEYQVYYNYCEECKAKAHKEVYGE